MAEASDKIRAIFKAAVIDQDRLEAVRKMADPAVKYMIAMTPRSGSSHLCDVLKNSKAFGRPGETLAEPFIPGVMKSAPAPDADEYVVNMLRVVASPNGVAGLKTSWFQFDLFRGALDGEAPFKNWRFIHLIRRDTFAQAVSLYRATASTVFHTNIEHGQAALDKLAALPYDYAQIKHWHNHILAQERGWREFFAVNNIFPLSITYEEIDDDVIAVVKRIAMFFGRPRAAERAVHESIFRKLGSRQSVEWAARFQLELDAELRTREQVADAAPARAQAAAANAAERPAAAKKRRAG